MSRATRKGKKHSGGRKHAVTRRTKHKHTKTCKHARRGGKKSGHKKRKHTRRGRKIRGGSINEHAAYSAAHDALAAVGEPVSQSGMDSVKENAFSTTLSGQGGTARNVKHFGNEIVSGLSHLNPLSW